MSVKARETRDSAFPAALCSPQRCPRISPRWRPGAGSLWPGLPFQTSPGTSGYHGTRWDPSEQQCTGTKAHQPSARCLERTCRRHCKQLLPRVFPWVTSPVSSLWKQTLVLSGLMQLSRGAKKGRFAEGGRGSGRRKAVPVTTS